MEETDMKKKMITIIATAAILITACAQISSGAFKDNSETVMASPRKEEAKEKSKEVSSNKAKSNNISVDFSVIDAEELFTDRDLEQSPDLSDAEKITVEDGRETVIDKEGTYVLTGNAKNASVIVEADSQDKIQLVLDGLTISNSDGPCIYVKSADKVFITTISDDNELSVTGSFSADGDTNTDAVIFSKDDLVLNGTGSLKIASTDNGISGKDGIKLTGGTLEIECEGSAVEAHEEILMADGKLEIAKCNDGLHAEDNDDDTTGFIYIGGGTLNITATDDAIHATTIVKIDDGNLTLAGAECIEGTAIQVNGGSIDINASDDGINAANKSSSFSPLYEQNGGNITITMGAGDTDGVDSNGDIRINGGTISIDGQSTFDYDGNAEYNGGTIIENGEETNTITNQFFGGPGGPGFPGGMDGDNRPEPPEGMDGNERPEIPEGMDGSKRPDFPEGMKGKKGPGNMGGHMKPGNMEGHERPDESDNE